MTEPFPILGAIMPFAGDYAPHGWAFCRGQVLRAAEYPELFLMLRDIYGGDGDTTFALPDLVGRSPIGAGVGADGFEMPLGRVSEPAPPTGASATRGPAPRGALAVNYVICVEGYFPPPPCALEAEDDAEEEPDRQPSIEEDMPEAL